jgi:hypothetical protein
VQGLLAAGYSVQLRHDETETTAADHGWITVYAADGSALATAANVQHNSRFRQRVQQLQAMVAQVVAATAARETADTSGDDGSDAA